MRAFLFGTERLQAITIDQAGKNLPDVPNGSWDYWKQIDDVAKTVHSERVQSALKDEGFCILPRSRR